MDSQALKKAVIFACLLGVPFEIILYITRLYPIYWGYAILLPIIAVVSYKYVRYTLPCIIFGLTTFLVIELTGSVIYGNLPFNEFQYLVYPQIASQIAIVYFVGMGGFPIVAYASSRLFQRRYGQSNFSFQDTTTNNLENRILAYIRLHNNQIRISDCASELGVDFDSIKQGLESLKKKGMVQT